MDYRNFITILFCLFFVSCSAPFVYTRPEFQVQDNVQQAATLQAKDHMQRAAALEDSQEYQQAAQEYAIIAERYPSTSYYQEAVRKAAILNIHPDNPETDAIKALHWLEIYLTLPLSLKEKESAQLHIGMLENINRLQAEIARQDADNSKLRKVTRKQSNKITADTQRMKELESELAQARIQLEEMKEVDLRMHTRRVNGSGGSPVEFFKKAQDVTPEDDSSATSIAKPTGQGKFKKTVTSQDKANFQTNNKGIAPLMSKESTSSKKQGHYPYTIQVSSFRRKEDAFVVAAESRNKGDIGFTSQTHIPSKGTWYRVFVGYYQTLHEAEKTANELKNGEYPFAFAVKMPFAMQIEVPSSEKDLKKMEALIQSKGYTAYKIPGRKNNDKTALLIGAYGTQEETLKYFKNLQESGLKLRVVQR